MVALLGIAKKYGVCRRGRAPNFNLFYGNRTDYGGVPAGEGFTPEIAGMVATFLTSLICYSSEDPCVLRAAFTDMAV